MSNRHLFLSTLHTNICSLYTKKFLKNFCKNTWLFAAPCGIIKGWGVGGTGVPYFFWSKSLSSIISYPEAKVNKNRENFLKKFFKKDLTFGSKTWYNKRGSIFFFFFFLLSQDTPGGVVQLQLPAPCDTPGCVAPAQRGEHLFGLTRVGALSFLIIYIRAKNFFKKMLKNAWLYFLYLIYLYCQWKTRQKKLFQKSFKKCLTFKKWFDIIKLSMKGKW